MSFLARTFALFLLLCSPSHGFLPRPVPTRTVSARSFSSITEEQPDPKSSAATVTTTSPATIATSTSTADDALLNQHKKWVRAIKSLLFDVLYQGQTMDRSYARFYALETIARMPYFSYTSVLHLLETLGQWRQADRLALHFAESWNEMHHLLVMEELLGEVDFRDRFIAQHVAFFYYWFAVVLYLWQPSTAYSLNQAVEEEAFETYDKFLQKHEEFLQSQPAPAVAVDYYTGSGKDLFERMHLGTPRTNIKCETLWDCFVAIRDDELEHSETMSSLKQRPDDKDIAET